LTLRPTRSSAFRHSASYHDLLADKLAYRWPVTEAEASGLYPSSVRPTERHGTGEDDDGDPSSYGGGSSYGHSPPPPPPPHDPLAYSGSYDYPQNPAQPGYPAYGQPGAYHADPGYAGYAQGYYPGDRNRLSAVPSEGAYSDHHDRI
jgi:hypothetical protein